MQKRKVIQISEKQQGKGKPGGRSRKGSLILKETAGGVGEKREVLGKIENKEKPRAHSKLGIWNRRMQKGESEDTVSRWGVLCG